MKGFRVIDRNGLGAVGEAGVEPKKNGAGKTNRSMDLHIGP